MTDLVFYHGWGLDDSFWNDLRALLPTFPQTSKRILIGHSLGFVQGLQQRQDWNGWIAINSFTRFIKTESTGGCVPAAILRAMTLRLAIEPEKTLQDFYKLIAARPPQHTPPMGDLREGLQALRDSNVLDFLASLNTPGLILVSRHDPLVPVTASEALGNAAQSSTLQWHETDGHVLPQSDPSWCAEAITKYVCEIIAR